eukprot:SAG31_NODE_30230_length_384_cov_0.491228_2_plen_40_part_01
MHALIITCAGADSSDCESCSEGNARFAFLVLASSRCTGAN